MLVRVRYLVLAAVCCSISACSSIHSTYLKRNKEMCGWETKHLRGTPITLDVPHHYKIEVIEICYEANGNILRDSKTNVVITGHEVVFDVVDSKEVFTVDFVKPGAGTLQTKVDFNPETQYVTNINNKIDDTTIETITASIKSLNGTLAIWTLPSRRNAATLR